MFEVGQKVVCVDDTFWPGINDIFNALPIKGHVYTVRDVVPGVGPNGNRDNDQQPSVYLVELVNMPNRHGVEPGFASHRFAEPEEISDSEFAHEELVEPQVH